MKFEYSQEYLAQKILKNAKKRDTIIEYILALIIICYVLFSFNLIKSGSNNIFEPLLLFICTWIIILLIIRKSNKNYIIDIMNLNYPEGLLNLSIYYYNYLINKKMPFISREKNCITHLSNIATAYCQMAYFDKAMEVAEYLEKQNIKNHLANNLKKLSIENIKTCVAFNNNNIEDFKTHNTKLHEIIDVFPGTFKNNANIKANIREAMLNNDFDKVNKLCDELDKSIFSSDKVSSAYCRAKILEKSGNPDFQKYYKYVADNGGTLSIANNAREKINITSFNTNNIKLKRNTGFKVFIILILFIIVSILFLNLDYVYEKTNVSWDKGEIILSNNVVNIPCSISEFESKTGEHIDTSKIDKYDFYELRLNRKRTTIDSYLEVDKYKKIELIIENNYITGIRVDISNLWNNELDTELGNLVIFPNNITANDSLESIRKSYTTGLLNVFSRNHTEKIKSVNGDDFSNTLSYKANKYCITINSVNGIVNSIFYYYYE